MSSTATQTVVLIGDVHDETEQLARSLELIGDVVPSVVLLAGDVGCDPPWHRAQRRTHRAAHDDSVRRVLGQVRATSGCPVVFVPGNHDLDDPPGDLPAVNADRRVVRAGGVTVAGFGGAGPTRFGFPYEWTEEQAASALEKLFAGHDTIDVFLSHSPPAGTTLDRTAGGQCVGGVAVRRWIERARPKLFVAGHIHEAWGVATVAGVPCVNAGALGSPYGQAIAWVVDWCDGPREIRAVRDEDGRRVERSWRVDGG